MIKFNKLSKITTLGVGAIALLMVGGNSTVQNTIQSAKNDVEMPVSHADNDNTFDLSKRIISKQFTVDGDNTTFSDMNKRVDKKVDKYLRSVNNLSDYQAHISRTGTIPQVGNGSKSSETATITFIRK